MPAYRNGRALIVNTGNGFNCAKHRNAINESSIYVYIYIRYIAAHGISSFIMRKPCDLYALCEFTIHGRDNLRRHGGPFADLLIDTDPGIVYRVAIYTAPLDRDYLLAGSVKITGVPVIG